MEERSGSDDETTHRGRDDDDRGSAPPALRLTCHAVTDRGVVRADNQDHFLLANIDDLMNASTAVAPADGAMVGAKRWLLAVADGVGGHAGGATASRSAIETILQRAALLVGVGEAVPIGLELKVSEWLRGAVVEADAALFRMMHRMPKLTGMATTLTLGVVIDDRLFVGHAGDSRAYLLRGGSSRRLTRDHTLLQEMIDSGLLPEESNAR
ncbi:MAG: PP2C family protein-serine/threonine phosphatase, partial [Planctomycetia bacterium]